MDKDGIILIMGVGGCGSGFIWHLLGDCGLETGGINEWMRHSGIRKAIANGTADNFEFPQVIKHLGGFLNNLNEHIDRHKWKVKHIFFAVASYDLQIKHYKKRRGASEEEIPELEKKYQNALGKGLIQLIERDHPFTIIRCPRTIKDPEYCYNKLKVVLPEEITFEKFKEIHANRISPRHLKRLDGYE